MVVPSEAAGCSSQGEVASERLKGGRKRAPAWGERASVPKGTSVFFRVLARSNIRARLALTYKPSPSIRVRDLLILGDVITT